MVKRRPGISILPLMLIVILCVSWLTQLNQRDEMTYDEMVQLFEQQKVEAFQLYGFQHADAAGQGQRPADPLPDP